MSADGRDRVPRDGRVRLAPLFGRDRPIVGMIHLPPLPGAPRWSGRIEEVLDRAAQDAEHLARAGVDGILVENFGDAPFHPGPVPPETVAAITAALVRVRETTDLPLGVNVLRNDARAALGIAAATGARFIRVNVLVGRMITDQGAIDGRAHEVLRVRRGLAPEVAILADVFVKHATPPPGLRMEEAARDTWERGLADALILSGGATGDPPETESLERVRTAVPEAPIWLGSGVGPESGPQLFPLCDGAIVGTAFQEDGVAGRPVDPERAAALIRTLRGEAGA